MRYQTMSELRQSISPDILIEDEPARPALDTPEIRALTTPVNRQVLENRFLEIWQRLGGPVVTREWKFHPTRKWRFDFALLEKQIAFEVQGGLYDSDKGHRAFASVQRDYEKFNAAMILGWKVFQLSSPMLKDAEYMQKLVDFCRRRE